MKKRFSILLTFILAITACLLAVSCKDQTDGTQPPSDPTKTYYTVTFDSNGGTTVAAQTVEEGKTATKPADPTKETANNIAYTFEAWHLTTVEGAAFDFTTPINSNITLVAKYTETQLDPTKTYYTVTFDSNGGTAVAAQTVEEGAKATAPTPPTKDGFTFTAWHVGTADGAVYDFNTPVTDNVTLVAVYEQENVFVITFDSKGGTAVETQNLRAGEKVTKPADPVKTVEGIEFTFVAWHVGTVDGEVFDFNSEVTASMVLVAEYEVWGGIV